MLHASRGLSKLRNKSWLIDLYGEDNASRCRCAPIPLYMYKDWLVVSLINQVDSTYAPVICVIFDCWVAPSRPIRWCCQTTLGPPRCCQSGAAARRWTSSSSPETWCVSERSQPTMMHACARMHLQMQVQMRHLHLHLIPLWWLHLHLHLHLIHPHLHLHLIQMPLIESNAKQIRIKCHCIAVSS